MNGRLGKQHSSVTLERRCRCASGAFLQSLRSLAPGNRALISRPALRGKNRLHHILGHTSSAPHRRRDRLPIGIRRHRF